MTAFGPAVTGKDVVDAVTATIQMWSPDYLAEVAAQHGHPRDYLPGFMSYVPMIDLNKFNEDQVPTCVVIAPGIIGTPEKHAKQVRARWSVGIGCVVSGQDDANTYDLMTLYAAAMRLLLLQKPSLGGFAEGVNWISERYDALPDMDSRTFGAAVIQFGVDVGAVADLNNGPVHPSVDPAVAPGDWPTVQTVDVTVQGVGANG